MKSESALLVAIVLGVAGCEKISTVFKRDKPASGAASEAVIPTTTAASGTRNPTQHLTLATYDEFIKQPGSLQIVDYYADWCPPCRMLGPVLEKMSDEFAGKVTVGKVNVDQEKVLRQQAGGSSIPDVRLFRDGREVGRFVGFIGEAAVRKLIATHTADLKSAPVATQKNNATATAKRTEPSIQPMKKDWMPAGMERR